ncbi:hypothetical protein FA95DRAFT_1573556 [Auriscalpium vulgare]|uniref:Uncharacterized protein n=1 Tax=Auriscalpium vulgare TaxID=40419 RepID=A0ACB8RNS1_9AGAM|nr:hypothetical protein FA95DRAFT_1573556 [Auriscalpium vulgare]
MTRLSQLLLALVAIAAASAMPMQKRSAEDSVTLAARACVSGSIDECTTALQTLHADWSPVSVEARQPRIKIIPEGVVLQSSTGDVALSRRLLQDIEARHSIKIIPEGVDIEARHRIKIIPEGVVLQSSTGDVALSRRLLQDIEARHKIKIIPEGVVLQSSTGDVALSRRLLQDIEARHSIKIIPEGVVLQSSTGDVALSRRALA